MVGSVQCMWDDGTRRNDSAKEEKRRSSGDQMCIGRRKNRDICKEMSKTFKKMERCLCVFV